ncbi:MAG: RdgB/HAM1 family non-canonical purine NTP pyrophosphatase [Geminicoccaceae bacterium]
MTAPSRRRFTGDRLGVATHNAGKKAEFRDLLGPLGVSLVDIDHLPEPEETGASFEANALLKAEAAVRATGLPALGDDSGLVCHGLDGDPGIYSARWAGEARDFAVAMARVLDELAARYGSFDQANRRAAFVAVLVLVWPDGHHESVRGTLDGQLIDPPRGDRGFGYDPMFLPDGSALTCAEMEPADKHRISHRGRAVRALIEACFEQPH